MVEIPGSVTIIPAPIEQMFLSIAEELILFFLIGLAALVVLRIYEWRIQKKIDAVNARMRGGMTR